MKRIFLALLLVTVLVLSVSGCFAETTYTVTFDADGGSAVASQVVNEGGKAIAPTTPTKEGYTFAGWYVGETAYDFDAAVNADVALKAKWTLNTYTVTFDADNGTESTTATVNHGDAAAAPEAPVKAGYTFGGWYLGEAAYDFATAVTGDIALKAVWTVNQYTITFDTDGGSEIAPIVQDFGTAIVAPAAPTKEGYTFAGWDKEIPVTMPVEGVTVKALWTVNQYTITFDTNGGSEIAPITLDFGAAVTAPAAPTKLGHFFAGWDQAIPATMPAENVTIKAAWTVKQYTITFDTDGGSEIAPITLDFGAAVTAPAAPTKVGHTFKGWDVEVPATMPAENVTVKALWDLNTYTVTFDAANGSAPTTVTVNYGATVTAPADPEKTGNTFAGWYLGEAAFVFDTPITGDITLTALWTLDSYTVTINADNGTDAVSTLIKYGETVTAPADPTKEGYTFAGWFVDGAAYDFATPVTGNVTIKAAWTINQYTITFDTDGGSTIAPITQNYGTDIGVVADPTKEGYTFAGWDVSIPTTMPAENVTVKALWKLNTYTVIFNADNGTLNKNVIVNHGDTVAAPADPVMEGYIFEGWFVGDTKYDFTTPVTGELDLLAKWTLITYTVTIDTANGAEATSETVAHGTILNLSEPTKAGFKFAGWTVNGEAYDPATPVTGSITVVATWVLDLPDLTAIAGKWTGDESLGYGATYEYTFEIAADGTITATYYNGYTDVTMTINYVLFENNVLTINYTAASIEGANMVFTLSDDKGTLSTTAGALGEAFDIKKTYTVIFDWGNYKDNETEIDPDTKEVLHGETVKAPTKSGWTGYEVKAWLLGGEAFDFTTPITSDMTLVANWGKKQNKVTFLDQDGNPIKEIMVNYNETIPQDQIPTTGIATAPDATFNGKWFGSATSNTAVKIDTVKISGAKTYYPGIIDSMADINGEWTATDDDGVVWTIVVDAANAKASLTIGADAAEVTWIRFQKISAKVQLVIKYIAAGKTSETTLALDYNTAAAAPLANTSLGFIKAGQETFNVTFDTDGGSAIDPQVIVKGELAQEPEAPTKDGFTFAGWYLNDVKYDFTTPITGGIILVAKWEEVAAPEVTYTVTFTNGTTTVSTQEVAAGQYATAPTDPSKSGKKFMGWFDGEIQFDAATPINGNFAFVAKWGVEVTVYNQSKEVVKTFIVEDGTVIPAEEIPAATVNEGFVFTGVWHKSYTVSAAPVDITAPVTAATKLYPGVIAESVTVLAGTWTGEKKNSSEEVTEIDTFVIDVIVDANGKVTGVTVTTTVNDVEDSVTTTYTPDQLASIQYNASGSNMQLCIKYYKTETTFSTFAVNYTTDGTVKYGSSVILEKELPSYTVTFDSNGGTAVDPQTVKEGKTATAPEAPTTETTGVVFGGWYNGEVLYDFATPVTGDITLTAKWVESKNLKFIKQDGTEYIFAAEKGKTLEAIITENYEIIMAGLTSADKSTIVKPATFDEMIAALVDALRTVEGSYYIGKWHTSLTGTSEVNFATDKLTANKNIAPAFIAPDVIKEIEGTWIATKTDGTVTGTFTTTIVTDDAGNIIDVAVKAIIGDDEFDSLWLKTYTKTNTAYQILIRYQKTATSQSTFTIKQVANGDGTHVWQYSSGTFAKDDGGPKKFVVSFDTKGAAAIDSQTIVEGEAATIPVAPSKEGFNFKGWYLDGAAYDFATPVTGNITIEAKWELNINTADVLGSWGYTIVGESYGYETLEDYLFIFFADGSVSATVTETMMGYPSPAKAIDVLSLTKLVYADGKIVFCEQYGTDITLEPKNILEDVKGVWAGNEDYAGTMIPYTLTINEDGTISGMCDMFGYEYALTLVSLDNKIVLDCMGSMTVTLVFDGEKLVGTGVMGSALTLTPYVDAADEITFEQLAGTWCATEDFYGMTFVYTFVINADGTGSAQYTSGADATVFNFEKYTIENNELVLKYTVGDSEYAQEYTHTFSLVDGKLVGVGPMGTEITLEKQ